VVVSLMNSIFFVPFQMKLVIIRIVLDWMVWIRDHFGESRSLEFMTNIMPSCEIYLFNLVLHVPLRFVGSWYKKLTNSSSSTDDGITCKYGLRPSLLRAALATEDCEPDEHFNITLSSPNLSLILPLHLVQFRLFQNLISGNGLLTAAGG